MGSIDTTAALLSPAEDEEAFLYAMQLASYYVLPFTLKTAMELGALEAITKSKHHLSPTELASKLHLPNPDAPVMLDRLLRLLARYNILTYSIDTNPEDGSVSRLYGPAPVCKYLTLNEDGVSLSALCLMLQDKVVKECWHHVKDAVAVGGIPFHMAYGMTAFEYNGKDLPFDKLFSAAMSNHSSIFMTKMLEVYDGFAGLSTVVDVGGSVGTALHVICSKYPEMKGVNFDLPRVIETAPEMPSVEHADGDMFERVPSGDAIFMKWILHDWSDDNCLKLLKNCHKALPSHGKVIVAEGILPDAPKSALEARQLFQLDVYMIVHSPGGKERTLVEYQRLAHTAGFTGFKVAAHVVHTGTYVLEFTK